MKIAIIGQGYVGLPLAIAAARSGFEVIGFDKNAELISNLKSGISHIEDISNSDLASVISDEKYFATSNEKDLADAQIAIIAVPTPLNQSREPDLSFIESACDILGKNLNERALIINESTSYPGTLRALISPRISALSELDHMYAISPERVDPGNKNWGISNTPRLYAGLTQEASLATRAFYEKFCSELIEVSAPEIAEAAKLFENSFRQVNIALVNELSLISRAMGFSVHEVLDAADTKPYGFMKFSPGIGVGGHCIPVDPSYLAYAARIVGVTPSFIELSNETNLNMPAKIVERIAKENGGSLKGKTILVCGISYKSDIADVRESPALRLIELLKSLGARVSWHDPLVGQWNGENSTDLAVGKFDIVVVTTLHAIMDKEAITATAKYIFDCTGTIASANKL
jgi:UDP-N-acetyl-D-glucosamine dehydrogenase